MTYGILILLFFFNIAIGIIIYYAIRLLLANQRALSQRISVVEEFMLELAPNTEDDLLDEFRPVDIHDGIDTEDKNSTEEINIAVANSAIEQDKAQESPVIAESVTKTMIRLESERVQSIVELSKNGFAPDAIAKQTGYSEGEILLALNLHRSIGTLR